MTNEDIKVLENWVNSEEGSVEVAPEPITYEEALAELAILRKLHAALVEENRKYAALLV